MNIENIPTPETDALLVKNAQSDTTGLEDYEILAEFAAGLERRLTVLTDLAQNAVNYRHGSMPALRKHILTLTAPKT